MSTQSFADVSSIEDLDFSIPCTRPKCGQPAVYLTKSHDCGEFAFCVECWDRILRESGTASLLCTGCNRSFPNIRSFMWIVGLI